MLPDQFARLMETMCGTADTITSVTSSDCGHSMCADTGIAHNHDP
jgi:hypothetical protein